LTTSGKKGFGKGKSPKKFSFTYGDLAEAAGLSVEAARKHAQRGNFDPNDLLSVLEFIQHRLSKNGSDLSLLVQEAREAAG
jgi:hypothetical protein